MIWNKWIAIATTVFVLAVAGWTARQWWPAKHGEQEEAEAACAEVNRLVRLSAAKLAVAEIRTQPLQRRSLTRTRVLPGRIVYDDRRHVAVRAATDGVVDAVLVKTGDKVSQGQVLAILRSPQVGQSRSEVLRCQSQLELANTERDWHAEICRSVERLAAELRKGKPLEAIDRDFQQARLGEYRGKLLAAYSQALMASQLQNSASGSAGALSGRELRQRLSRQQQAKAELEGGIEQALFETRQACKAAKLKADAARRNLSIARQSLATLSGAGAAEAAAAKVGEEDVNLGLLQVRSPLAGTVERRVFSTTERVAASAEMFVVADTTRLWVEADVRGGDWQALQIKQGDEVSFCTAADPQRRLPGRVHYVGRELDPATGAVPLVVDFENPGDRYRPGLFARVEVPVEQIVDVIAVPESAIVDLGGNPSVFVVEGDGYRPVTVQLGARCDGLVEVQSGIRVGQAVVVSGAFILKSELLLEEE